jgi:(p)ppGpp synthase/HD superfamily hydrolase
VAPTSSLSSEVSRAEAIRFAIAAYEGVATRPGKGIPHAQAVADVLRNAGVDEGAQVAALLHDVVEDTPCTVEDVRARFGDDVAATVGALTEDRAIRHYAQRKRDISLADKIASLRHALVTGSTVSRRKVSHYRASLQLGRTAGANEALCAWLEDLLSALAHREAAAAS